ncbi:MAG: DUF72 domain-containing protein [Deltaproteobacteria bacterium]
MHYFLGCPEWSRPEWKGSLLPTRTRPADFLAGYARVFNTVEGNTTFYALPRPDVVERWKESTPSNFRFCFKFPRSISHDRKLENTTELTREFFQRIAPLEERVGPIQLQLSADFGRNRWPQLQQFLRQLPSDFRYAVEVRNLAYFDGQETEQELDTSSRQRMSYRCCALSGIPKMSSITQCCGIGLNEWLAGCDRVSLPLFFCTPQMTYWPLN